MHSLEEAEEDIYDFSGVSYDLTSLRSELMQFREKGKPTTTPRFNNCEDYRNDISEKYNNYVLPSSSSIFYDFQDAWVQFYPKPSTTC